MSGNRNDDGHYAQRYTESDVLEAFEAAPVPVLTTSEVAAHVGCSTTTARRRLDALVEDDRLLRKQVGARAVVYVRVDPDVNRESGYGEWKASLWK